MGILCSDARWHECIRVAVMVEGSLEVKLPTIWTDEKQSRAEAERRERLEERRVERKSKKKEDADARKGRKVAIHGVFQIICGSGGSKSRLAKAAGAEAAGEMRDEKLHAVVARSTFPSQNVQNTPGADHFWYLRCRKGARRCGAKHISKSKCTKDTILGPLLEVSKSSFEKVHAVVARSTFPSENVQNTPCSDHFWKLRCRKKCTPLWREAHFEVKTLKTLGFRTTFGSSDVEKVHAVVARSIFSSQNVKTLGFRTAFGGSDVASLHQITLHYTTVRCTTLHYTTLHYTTLHNTTGYNYNYTTTLHYTPLH